MRGKRLKSKKQLYKSKKKKIIKDMTSKSEKFLLDSLETIYNIKIERQYQINHKYFDGRYAMHIIECDGSRWHSNKKDLKNDIFKDEIAKRNGFEMHRIQLNRIKEVPKCLQENKLLFDKIFNV